MQIIRFLVINSRKLARYLNLYNFAEDEEDTQVSKHSKQTQGNNKWWTHSASKTLIRHVVKTTLNGENAFCENGNNYKEIIIEWE